MQIPGVHIETIYNPVRYTRAQIEHACEIAHRLNRGKLVLLEPPTHEHGGLSDEDEQAS